MVMLLPVLEALAWRGIFRIAPFHRPPCLLEGRRLFFLREHNSGNNQDGKEANKFYVAIEHRSGKNPRTGRHVSDEATGRRVTGTLEVIHNFLWKKGLGSVEVIRSVQRPDVAGRHVPRR